MNAIDWCTTVTVAPISELEGKDGIPWTGSARLTEPLGKPDSVRARGRQLVAVAAGMHAPLAWQLESEPAQVIVFGLH